MNAIVNLSVGPLTEWLLHVRPVGLVLAPNIIREEQLTPTRQSAVDTEAVKLLLAAENEEGTPHPARSVAVLFQHSELGSALRRRRARRAAACLRISSVNVREHEVTLAPDWAVRELGEAGGYQLLVKLLS